MKNLSFVFSFILIATFAACTPERTGEDADVTDPYDAAEVLDTYMAYEVNTETSTLGWRGRKIGGEHYGTIEIANGNVYVYDGNLVAGYFIIDMHTIVNIDLEDAEQNARLVGHLESADFFEVETYPSAEFELSGVSQIENPEDYVDEGYTHYISGNLTMKGITNGITFPARVSVADDQLTANAHFNIDRAKWNVRYGSESFFDNLGDDVIMDEINLKLDLVADFSQEVEEDEVEAEIL
jgi:polyisoprenoid-binding protein YceI